MVNVVEHPMFFAWLVELKHWFFYLACVSGRKLIRIVFICRAGRHRSVACGRIGTALMQAIGINCSDDPTHHASNWWKNNKKMTCYGTCEQCGNGDIAPKQKASMLGTS